VAVRRVTLNKPSAVIPVGATEKLTATVTPYNAANKNVTWSSNNINVAIVNSKGAVTGISEGTAAITVTSVDGGFTAECAVTVKPVAVPVTGVKLDRDTATVSVGATERLTATVAPEDADNKNVVWSSDSAAIATVSDDGAVTGVAAGTTTVRATTEEGGFVATCVVEVLPVAIPVTDVTLDRDNATVSIGGTERLIATVLPDTATNQSVSWSSDDTDIATVADDGTVTGIAAGTATVTVTSADGGFTATCTVKVEYGMGTVTSTGWTAPERGRFEYSMTYVTQIAFEDVVSQNPNTELAAFVGTECRGLAKLVHDTTLDRWLVYLTVFGNTSGETVVLKAYNPDKLRIYEDCKTFTFGNNTSLGSASEILNCR
jgi:uncharacterized protein YjdB